MREPSYLFSAFIICELCRFESLFGLLGNVPMAWHHGHYKYLDSVGQEKDVILELTTNISFKRLHKLEYLTD